MVKLTDLEAYWRNMIKRVPALKRVDFVTEEGDMKEFIQDISAVEQPFLVVVIPSAKGGGVPDAVSETNMNLIYLLSKEDSMRKSTFQIQKELQPVMESIKEAMISDIEECGLMRKLDLQSMQTDPEKRMLTKATGWSLSFEMET